MAGTFLIGREQRFWERSRATRSASRASTACASARPSASAGVDIGSVQSVSVPKDPASTYVAVSVNIAGSGRLSGSARIRSRGSARSGSWATSTWRSAWVAAVAGAAARLGDPLGRSDRLRSAARRERRHHHEHRRNDELAAERLAADRTGEGLLGQLVKNREQGATTLADLQRTVAHVEATTARSSA